MGDVIHKFVNDLGLAAYVLMHGYAVVGKRGRSIFFECNSEEEAAEFDRLILEYQPPNEFYTFDSCLMFLKKINEVVPEEMDETIHKCVIDLGVAAYLLMQEYRDNSLGVKVIGKKGKYVYFEHPEGKGDEFERLSYQYLPSQFQTYDSNLMALKKIGEYMPVK
jgi:hypothetical protein|tara:strand:- start:513 stop:1004 length:492 start_codon:yes stop_codon:yes gene_type:complete